MRRGLFSIMLLLVSVVTIFLLMDYKRPPETLTIGLIPSNHPETMAKNFAPITDYLQKQMGYAIEVVVPSDYIGLIDAMKNKKVDIGWFGAFSYIAAEGEMALEPMVIQQRIGSGITYHSLIITRQDSEIRSVDDLEGKTFAFVDRGSTSGFVIPYSLLKSRNIDYKQYFSDVIYSGTHDDVLMDVFNKKVDAGAMEDLTYKKMIDGGKVRAEDVRIIWQSNEIPGSPFVARADLHPDAKKKFKQAMITMHDNAPEAIRSFDSKIQKYVEFEDSLYNEIRNISTLLGRQFIFENFLQKK